MKETLTIDLDREVYNSWCNIGTALSLTTNSQIAQYLVHYYQVQADTETKKLCGTCKNLLMWYCANCFTKQSLENIKCRKTPSKSGHSQTKKNHRQRAVSLLNKSDAAPDKDYFENNTFHSDVGDQTCMEEQTKQRLVKILVFSKNNEKPLSSVSKDGECVNVEVARPNSGSPPTNQKQVIGGGIASLLTSQTENLADNRKTNNICCNQQVKEEQIKEGLGHMRSPWDGLGPPASLSGKCFIAREEKGSRTLNLQKNEPSPEKIRHIPSQCDPAFSTELQVDAGGFSQLNSIVFTVKKLVPGQANHKPVKMISLLKKDSLPVPILHAVDASENGGTNLCEQKSVTGQSNCSSQRNEKINPSAEFSHVNHKVSDTDAFAEKLTEGQSKQTPVIQISVLKKSLSMCSPELWDKDALEGKADDTDLFHREDGQTRQKKVGKSLLKCDTVSSLGENSVNFTDTKSIQGQTKQSGMLPKQNSAASAKVPNKNTVMNSIKGLYCHICKRFFSTARRLEAHREIVHAGLHPCNCCEKTFQNAQLLQSHAVVHCSSRDHMCEVCGRCFKRQSHLQRHILLHKGGPKPYLCSICSSTFTRLAHLKNHTLKHSLEPGHHRLDVKQVMCDTCGKSYASSYIKLHKMIHTGEKPHVCGVCNKGFVQYNCFKQHTLMHTGEKPYVCKICNKAFTFPSCLRSHKLIHESRKPFICNICNKEMKNYRSFQKHVRDHNKNVHCLLRPVEQL